MAEASSRLDINLEASGKINGLRYISVFFSKQKPERKESEEVRSVVNVTKIEERKRRR